MIQQADETVLDTSPTGNIELIIEAAITLANADMYSWPSEKDDPDDPHIAYARHDDLKVLRYFLFNFCGPRGKEVADNGNEHDIRETAISHLISGENVAKRKLLASAAVCLAEDRGAEPLAVWKAVGVQQ